MTITTAAVAAGWSVEVSPVHAALPTGFTETTVADTPSNPLTDPVDIVPVQNGNAALILERSGTLRTLTGSTLSATDDQTLDACTGPGQGLLAGASTPLYQGDVIHSFTFVLYSHNAGDCNTAVGHSIRLSEFVESVWGDTTEQVLLDNIPSGTTDTDASMAIGRDGYLYVALGDSGTNPRGGGGSAAQDLSLLNGKVLRLAGMSGAPTDNPFAHDPTAQSCATTGLTAPTTAHCTEIYSVGLHDPGTLAVDPGTANPSASGSVLVNDAGLNTWEEIDQVAAGANFGWDTREGPCATGSTTICAPTPAGLTDPIASYGHTGGCDGITAGAFVPNGVWPQQFDGSYLFADVGCGKVWQRTPSGAVDYANPVFQLPAGVIDMEFAANKVSGVHEVPQVTHSPTLFYITTADNLIHEITFNLTPPAFVGTSADVAANAAPGANGAVVTYVQPSAQDNRGAITPTCAPASGAVFALGATTVTCTATNDAGSATRTFTVTVSSQKDFVPLPPARLADTRPASPTVDGAAAGGGAVAAGSTYEVQVGGRGGVVAGATAASLNVTAVAGNGAGFATVYPCGAARPTASNLNFASGSVVPNAVVTKLGPTGLVCVYVSSSTNLVVDVNGYFPTGTSLTSLDPVRLLDTRSGMVTFDGIPGDGLKAAGTVRTIVISGRDGVPFGSSAAVLNVTVTEPDSAGFVTVYPCGSERPTTSTLNYSAGSTVANLAVSKVGAGNAVCVYTQQATHVVVDLDGYFPAITGYVPLVPARLLDTRAGQTTVDGQGLGGGTRPTGIVTTVQVAGRAGVPALVATAVLNVTVTNPVTGGFVTAYPCGIDPPVASNVNFTAGQTIANSAIVKLSAAGTVCLFNSQATDLVADVVGYEPL